MAEKKWEEYTDFELANAYFNRIKPNMESAEDFWEEVDKRRGEMLRSEWLDYHY